MNVITILCDTLRRDHVSAYTGGRPLNECWSPEAPEWRVLTPNIDRLANRGTRFTNCYHGSTPCMPARRDLYTGRYEFPWRGWAPLEEEDFDLPRQVSGEPNQSITKMQAEGWSVSYLVTDHFHLWEQGSGNYHMGYTGFQFIRGMESDNWHTDPGEFACPAPDRGRKLERHWHNAHHDRHSLDDWFAARTFRHAAEWLERNHTHQDFFLHIDSFEPHEPLDPPEEFLKLFDPKGYSVEGMSSGWPYAPWRNHLTEEQFRNFRARYAAKVVFLDRCIGKLLDVMDRRGLWENTVVVFTTDHGTFNGDHGRIGKLQTHEFDCKSHIPFLVYHPEHGHGETRDQLVQNVDIYPTVLSAVGKPIPADRHGVDLLPVLRDPDTHTRDYAVYGQFGQSVGITDGRWVLHQAPTDPQRNEPLNWYSPYLAKFLKVPLGAYDGTKRPVDGYRAYNETTWLSDKAADPNERTNLADEHPEQVARMQEALRGVWATIGAPPEQLQRLGIGQQR